MIVTVGKYQYGSLVYEDVEVDTDDIDQACREALELKPGQQLEYVVWDNEEFPVHNFCPGCDHVVTAKQFGNWHDERTNLVWHRRCWDNQNQKGKP